MRSLGRVSAYTQAGLVGECLLTHRGGVVSGRRGPGNEDSYDNALISTYPLHQE